MPILAIPWVSEMAGNNRLAPASGKDSSLVGLRESGEAMNEASWGHTLDLLWLFPVVLALAEYDQPYGGFLDILRGGTERLFTNLKDTSSKVIQSVAK